MSIQRDRATVDSIGLQNFGHPSTNHPPIGPRFNRLIRTRLFIDKDYTHFFYQIRPVVNTEEPTYSPNHEMRKIVVVIP